MFSFQLLLTLKTANFEFLISDGDEVADCYVTPTVSTVLHAEVVTAGE